MSVCFKSLEIKETLLQVFHREKEQNPAKNPEQKQKNENLFLLCFHFVMQFSFYEDHIKSDNKQS